MAPESGSFEPYCTPPSTPRAPAYTPDELATIFLDFYTFLATLHYDPADLKTPPPGGWPGLTVELCAGFKSDFAIEVLRHLPYFTSAASVHDISVHYKSDLVDYTSLGRDYFLSTDRQEEYNLPDMADDSREIDLSDLVFIAWGHESGGRDLMLNVRDGEIIEESIRCERVGSFDVKDYFDRLKEAYRSLKLIPCLQVDTVEAWDVPERAGEISIEEVRAQTEKWRTDLDVQYIRQIYRQHGWPDAFRKNDAMHAYDEMREERDI